MRANIIFWTLMHHKLAEAIFYHLKYGRHRLGHVVTESRVINSQQLIHVFFHQVVKTKQDIDNLFITKGYSLSYLFWSITIIPYFLKHCKLLLDSYPISVYIQSNIKCAKPLIVLGLQIAHFTCLRHWTFWTNNRNS